MKKADIIKAIKEDIMPLLRKDYVQNNPSHDCYGCCGCCSNFLEAMEDIENKLALLVRE